MQPRELKMRDKQKGKNFKDTSENTEIAQLKCWNHPVKIQVS